MVFAKIVPILLVLSLPLASAGTEQSPEVTDAEGDAGPNLIPAPAGYGWGDIVAAWFESDTPESFTLKIEVADATVPPTDAVIGLYFESAGERFMAGWFSYGPDASGAFLCKAGADGAAPTSCSDHREGSQSGPVYAVTNIPRDYIGALDQGSVLDKPEGFAWHGYLLFGHTTGVVTQVQYALVDETPVGEAYEFVTGMAPVGEPIEPTSATESEQRSTPGVQIIVVGPGIALIALITRKRRG